MIYKCKNCGGNAIYNPESGKMHCPFCDSDDSEEVVTGTSLGMCPSCGAQIELEAKEKSFLSACKCEHCGNYMIFDERVEGIYEPHLIVPFKIGKNQVKEILKQEFAKKVFLPASFLWESKLETIEGMYVPFWLYDYMAHYTYNATGTKLRVWRSGDTEYTEHKIYSIIREMNIDFEKIPVDASIAMEDGVMDLMEPYNYQALEAFQAKYMSGFFSEIYNEGSSELEERAKKKVGEDSRELMQATISGYNTVNATNDDLTMKRDGTHYALMPVWIYQYSYRKKEYRFYINGQTGKVIGETPVDYKKAAVYGTTLFASAVAAASLLLTFLEVL